jgi:O-antigen ligase
MVTERAYAVVAMFTLTQGPVYRLWSESAGYVVTSPEPTLTHAYFATFVAVQLPALFIVGRTLSGEFLRRRSTIALFALVGWLGVTVAWSTLARYSLPEFVALVCTTAFGLYLATRFPSRTAWWIVAGATATGLLVSVFSVWRDWPGSVDATEGYWVGIYYNRNSLAPVAAAALIAAAALAVGTVRRSRSLFPGLAASLALGALALVVLLRSESQTAPFALLVAACAVVVFWSLRWATRRIGVTSSWWSPTLLTLVVTAAAVFVAMRTIGSLSGISGEATTFNSRGPLWSLSWSGFQLKPWHGWGWQAAWHTPEFFKQGVWWAAWNTTWSHNGYFDLLLGGGVLAALLFVAYFATASRDLDRLPGAESGFRLVAIVFVLAAATQESFFIGSHFLWALTVATASVMVTKPAVSVDEHHAGERTA